MARNTEERRTKLREKLIDIAEARIAEEGLSAIKARALAQEAGAAVGAIYTVFDDLTDLILEVNGRTFKRLGVAVSEAAHAAADETPSDHLVALGLAYLQFAKTETLAWRTLFEVELTEGHAVPGWYLAEMQKLFSYIGRPVTALYPDLGEADSQLMVRALFSSVHGIVWLGLERRISGVPTEELPRMIELTLRNLSENRNI